LRGKQTQILRGQQRGKIPYIYPAFVPFGRYFTSIPLYLWIRQSPLSSTCWQFLCCDNINLTTYYMFKGILSTSCVIFSYTKLLSISVLTFIKWRLTPSYAAKDMIFWQKRPKTIVDHMNRFEYCHPDNNYNNDSFGSFLSKNHIFCSITRC
jgi:hypothetical protein